MNAVVIFKVDPERNSFSKNGPIRMKAFPPEKLFRERRKPIVPGLALPTTRPLMRTLVDFARAVMTRGNAIVKDAKARGTGTKSWD